MTNAEKLAKDIQALALLLQYYCGGYCIESPLERIGCRNIKSENYDDIVNWLESEVEEDAEVH